MSLRLNLDLVRRRRIAADLSLRNVADALGWSEGPYRNLEAGLTDVNLTVTQLGVLADLLAVPAADLLADGPPAAVPAAGEELDAAVGAVLFVAGRAVPLSALAEVLDADTEAVAASLDRLRTALPRLGLAVSVAKPGATLLPVGTPTGQAATRRLLRAHDRRGTLQAPAARMLHELARGRRLPQAPKQRERHQLAGLVAAGWVRLPDKRPAAPNAAEVHPDVLFSLVLEDGAGMATATATMWDPPKARRQFTWLNVDTAASNDDDAADEDDK